MATVKRCRRMLILKGWAVRVGRYTVQKHASLEAASWHAYRLNAGEARRLAVVNMALEDAKWAGRC